MSNSREEKITDTEEDVKSLINELDDVVREFRGALTEEENKINVERAKEIIQFISENPGKYERIKQKLEIIKLTEEQNRSLSFIIKKYNKLRDPKNQQRIGDRIIKCNEIIQSTALVKSQHYFLLLKQLKNAIERGDSKWWKEQVQWGKNISVSGVEKTVSKTAKEMYEALKKLPDNARESQCQECYEKDILPLLNKSLTRHEQELKTEELPSVKELRLFYLGIKALEEDPEKLLQVKDESALNDIVAIGREYLAIIHPRKIPGPITLDSESKMEQLKPGDIILFAQPFDSSSMVTKAINLAGILASWYHHGHSDTTHVGICSRYDEKGQPLIAHVIGGKVMGYTQQTIRSVLDASHGDRAFIVFRPKSPTMASLFASAATEDPEKLHTITYATAKTSFTFLKSSPDLDPDREVKEKEISLASFCSKFVVQCIKKAVRESKDDQLMQDYDLDIRSEVLPKDIEDRLYRSEHYNYFVYPGQQAYEELCDVITSEIERIRRNRRGSLLGTINKKVENKFIQCRDSFDQTKKFISANGNFSNLEKCYCLLMNMMPVLGIQTGITDTLPESYVNVFACAEKHRIFLRDILNYQYTLEQQKHKKNEMR